MALELDLHNISGLSDEEAARKLAEAGHNELPSARKRSILRIAFDVVREPMFLLLIAVGIIYLFLGDLQEALILMSFVVVVVGITLYQERKTERALEALRDLSSPRANVIRSGELKRIAGREVVPGDTLILEEGDRVPADAVLTSNMNLSVDESLLTGESIPVQKDEAEGNIDDIEMGSPGGDGRPFVYSGTMVVQGRAVAVVKSTGTATEMGKIGKALESISHEDTVLQKETRKVVRNIAVLGIMLCVLVVVVYGVTRHYWIAGLLAGLTLAMAMLPEEFPVVLTIFLAMGAWRISKKEVLTRQVPAVETLGSATVLCVDKTGTLTFNRISVSRMVADNLVYSLGEHLHEPLPEELHELVEFSILASHKDPFDPIELAIKRLGDRKLFQTEHLHDDWSLLREYPLSRELMALSHVWKSPGGKDYLIAAKGAPEAIADLCHMPGQEKADMLTRVSEMAADGLRVIGVAKALFTEAELPVNQHDFVFQFLGLIGLADPVRPTVPEAILQCHTAGIRVIMITGDYPGTAQNIARQIELEPCDRYITGEELDAMDDDELRERIKNVCIFARVVPEQKLRIVDALKANGEVVAMTGDGVNDAPALKSANIGVAMGGRGTDVARESAALVLLNDDFSSIVDAVRMGRRIFDNLKKAMSYILAVHVPIAGMSLIPVLFKMPLILMPVHIAFLELIIDPACSIVFECEPEEAGIMDRKPRALSDPLFNKQLVGISLLQGVFVLGMLMLLLLVSRWQGQTIGETRALVFTALVIANLCLIMINRSWSRTILGTMRKKNAALWWVVGGALIFLAAVLYVPWLSSLFGFAHLSLLDIAICISAGFASILWFEVMKLIRRKSII